MEDINSVCFTGNVVRDGVKTVLKKKADGGEFTIVEFSIAVNGREKDEVSYFSCKVVGKYAEALFPKIKKGVFVVVKGEMKQERWEKDVDGEKALASKDVVQVENMRLL